MFSFTLARARPVRFWPVKDKAEAAGCPFFDKATGCPYFFKTGACPLKNAVSETNAKDT
jgi:hypothetical protein